MDLQHNHSVGSVVYLPQHAEPCNGRWVHLHGLAPGQHRFEETSQRLQTVGNIVSELTGPRIEPKTSRADSDAFNYSVNRPVEW